MQVIKLFKTIAVFCALTSFCHTRLSAQLDTLRSPRYGSFNISLGGLGYQALNNSNVGYLKFTPFYSPKIDLGYEYIFNTYKIGLELNAGLSATGYRMRYDKSMKGLYNTISNSKREMVASYFSGAPWQRYFIIPIITRYSINLYNRILVNKYFALPKQYLLKATFGMATTSYTMENSQTKIEPVFGRNNIESTIITKVNSGDDITLDKQFSSLVFKIGVGKLYRKRLLTIDLEFNKGLETIYQGTIIQNENIRNQNYISSWSWTNTYLGMNVQYGLGKWRKGK
jgi:hypothetical protein